MLNKVIPWSRFWAIACDESTLLRQIQVLLDSFLIESANVRLTRWFFITDFWVFLILPSLNKDGQTGASSYEKIEGSGGPAAQMLSEVPSTPSPSTTSSTSVSQSEEEEEENIETPAQEAKKPAQEKCKLKIADLNKQVVSLTSLRDSGLSGVTKAQIDSIRKVLHKEEIELKKRVREASRMRNRREMQREGIEQLCEEDPKAAQVLKSCNRSVIGRPRIEVDQPDLLSAIVNIVTASSATDNRRHCEMLRTVTTLDDLHSELKKVAFKLSRCATYLRLLPRRGNTVEGKRHVETVPVKLLRPENNLRIKNTDRLFAKSVIDDMFAVAKMFGQHVVSFLSNDDKARVPLGLAAANLQAPILMHLEYKVILPDHLFVVAPAHKLIPSVYGICNVTPKGDVSYTGETFIRISSAKHDTSNAYTHAHDIIELFKCKDIPQKPILLIESDGAQDEAPRFPKPMYTAIYLFREFKLDALIHGVNAAGLSAFNPVERRMAPLSHDVAGVILPHDAFGTHINSGVTVDEELEKQNFYKAAETLAEIWYRTVIDGHDVDARAMPLNQQFVAPIPDPTWVSKHVQQTRYALQIVKCGDSRCCEPFVTNWAHNFPDRFLPVPAV